MTLYGTLDLSSVHSDLSNVWCQCRLVRWIICPDKSYRSDKLKNQYRMHCKIVFNFALRHDLALEQGNRLLD